MSNNLKKKYQIKYSLMILLQKQYKLRLNFNFVKANLELYRIIQQTKKNKSFYFGSTIYDKGIEPFLELNNNLFVKKLFKETLNPSFFFSGSFIWNILLNSLKTSSFLLTEKNLRLFNLRQDDNSLLVKSFITFLFQKNYGFLIFEIFNKKQFRQKLLVQFLTLNNFVNVNNFSVENQDTYTKKLNTWFTMQNQNSFFFQAHLTNCPTWEKFWFYVKEKKDIANQLDDITDKQIHKLLLKYDNLSLSRKFNVDEPMIESEFIEDYSDDYDVDLEDNMTRTYVLSDHDEYYEEPSESLAELLEMEPKFTMEDGEKDKDGEDDENTLDWDEEDDGDESFYDIRENHMKHLRRVWPYIPKFVFREFANHDLENENQDTSYKDECGEVPQFRSLYTSPGLLPEEEDYYGYEEDSLSYIYNKESVFDEEDFQFNIVFDAFSNINHSQENSYEPLMPTSDPEFSTFYPIFDFDLIQENILDKLQLFDFKQYQINIDQMVVWNWKTLVTYSNFQNINAFEHDFDLLSFSKLTKKFRQKLKNKNKNFRLFSKNFYLSQNNLLKYYKKVNYLDLTSLIFDPIPFSLLESSVLKELHYFEQLFFLNTNLHSANQVFLQDSNLLPFQLSLNTELLHFKKNFNEPWGMENYDPDNYQSEHDRLFDKQQRNSLFTTNLLLLTDKNDFYPQLKIVDLITKNDELAEITELTFDMVKELTLVNSMTWLNWSVSFYENLTNKLTFFSHPFFNQFHQILYQFFFKQLLVNYLYNSHPFLKQNKIFGMFRNFWEIKNTKRLIQGVKSEIIFDLFLEKLDFSEDFLIRRFSRLNLLDFNELQSSYPLQIFETNIVTAKTLNHFYLKNFRKFWENTTDLYDQSFLHFADARWQDYIPLIKAPQLPSLPWSLDMRSFYQTDSELNFFNQTKFQKKSLPQNLWNFWPDTMHRLEGIVSSNSQRDYLRKKYINSDLFTMQSRKSRFQKNLFKGLAYPFKKKNSFSAKQKLRRIQKSIGNVNDFLEYKKIIVPPFTNKKKFRMTNRNQELALSFSLRYSYSDVLNNPDLFVYGSQPAQISFKKNQQVFQENVLQKPIPLNKFYTEHQSTFIDSLENRAISYISPFWYAQNDVQQRQFFFSNFVEELSSDQKSSFFDEGDMGYNNDTFLNLVSLDKKKIVFDRFLQRFVPTGYYYSNFLLFLNQRNKRSVSNWLQQDGTYFHFLFLFNLVSLKNVNLQELSVSYLFLKKLSVKTLNQLLKKKMYTNHLFENLTFFRQLNTKFTNSQDLLNFINLLQIALFDRSKKDYNLIIFLNKLYFFFDFLKLIEEPLSEFWSGLFTSYEIGELSTQTNIYQIANIQKETTGLIFEVPQYNSFTLLLWSFFNKEQKLLLQNLVSTKNNEVLFNQKNILKNLNFYLFPMYMNLQYFTTLTLFSSLQYMRSFDKQLINLCYQNLTFNTKKTIFYHIFLLDQYKQQQADNFCYNQSLLASYLYQYEQFLIFSNYQLWKLAILIRVNIIIGLLYFLIYYFFFFCCFFLLGLSLFFSIRFIINKSLLNNFSSYCYSLYEINLLSQRQKTQKKVFPTTLRKIQKRIREETKKQFDEDLGVSVYSLVIASPKAFLKDCFLFEYRLCQHYSTLSLENSQIKYKLNQLNSFIDFNNPKISTNLLLKVPEKFLKKVSIMTMFENNNFILPLSQSVSSLEQFTFTEVDTAKQMILYWGMPFFNDKSNRNPLFYVLQLSEDYKFFRLFKSKFLYKWFFF